MINSFFCNFAVMNNDITRTPRSIIRIGRQTLMFASPLSFPPGLRVEPYIVKSGMSMAANLREAFRESGLLSLSGSRVQVLLDSDVLLVPLDEYDEDSVSTLYHHTFPSRQKDIVLTHVIPGLNCVAVYSINKDLRLVITDHFPDVRIMPVLVPVWTHLHQLSYAGRTRKLYAYAHDGSLAVFSFANNRFRFMNTFVTSEITDTAYYILYVWQQLAFDRQRDEIVLVGAFPDSDMLRTELRRYVANVYLVSPSAEFNRSPITQIPHITYDLICLCES